MFLFSICIQPVDQFAISVVSVLPLCLYKNRNYCHNVVTGYFLQPHVSLVRWFSENTAIVAQLNLTFHQVNLASLFCFSAPLSERKIDINHWLSVVYYQSLHEYIKHKVKQLESWYSSLRGNSFNIFFLFIPWACIYIHILAYVCLYSIWMSVYMRKWGEIQTVQINAGLLQGIFYTWGCSAFSKIWDSCLCVDQTSFYSFSALISVVDGSAEGG